MIIASKYSIINEQKKSNYSATYICENLHDNNEVFVKTINLRNEETNIAKELFKREVKALSLLNNENIIKILDSGIDTNGTPYIVTEYLRQNKLDLADKIDMMLKILSAINYSHDRNIIHRDIKPQNILVNDDLDVKIVDYGISKIIGVSYNPSETVKNYMSLRYASPEQLIRLEINIQSDLYSLGLLFAFYFVRSRTARRS